MKHGLSSDDRAFRARFETGDVAPAEFNHRAHVRLAYVYLADNDTGHAVALMRGALRNFLRHHGVPATKYHETLTRAWVLAVRHFMNKTAVISSADAFIAANPVLLDSMIMLTHYSAELLFSDQARGRFVEPDLSDIPA
jgi:hypothetical protein